MSQGLPLFNGNVRSFYTLPNGVMILHNLTFPLIGTVTLC